MRNLTDPVCEVVVGDDAGDLAAFEREEGSGGENVGLAFSFGKAGIGGEIGAVNDEFGGATGAFGVGEDHHVFEFFFVRGAHVIAEGGKFLFTDTDLALVDVMGHVIGKAGEHGFGIACVEGLEIGGDGGAGLIGHGNSPRVWAET